MKDEERKILAIVGGGFLLWIAIVLGFWGTVIYIAIHFLMKLW